MGLSGDMEVSWNETVSGGSPVNGVADDMSRNREISRSGGFSGNLLTSATKK